MITEWPHFEWNRQRIIDPLASVRYKQGCLIGHIGALDLSFQQDAELETLTPDVLKSSEIEDELLDPEQVRCAAADSETTVRQTGE